MRIRSIKPAYWTDPDLHTGLDASAREFYIGLWMLADDSGWIEWEPRRIGAELYPFLTMTQRLRLVGKNADALRNLDPQSPHLVVLACGHARVPKMPNHQHLGGKPVFTVERKHFGCKAAPQPSPEFPGVPPDAPHRPPTTPHGKGSNGEVSKGGVQGGLSNFERPTEKKKPDDEELVDRYLNDWAKAATEDRRSMYATQLRVMGITDPAAELARRVAA